MWEWSVIIPAGTVVVAVIGLFVTNGVRYFTLREHEAYLRANDAMVDAMNQRLTDILDRIKTLEQTRPTTGELKAWVTRQINGDK